MCGRYTLKSDKKKVAVAFDIDADGDVVEIVEPRFNVLPSERILVVRVNPETKKREMRRMQWGLMPPNPSSPEVRPLINARVWTLLNTDVYGDAIQRRRCLIPADGFFEWQAVETKTRKVPHYIHMKDSSMFGFAGVWQEEPTATGKTVLTCSILTTNPNALVKPIHNRMPVIILPKDYAVWLDPGVTDTEKIKGMLKPLDPALMEVYPVSTDVNRRQNDSVDLIKRVEIEDGAGKPKRPLRAKTKKLQNPRLF